MSDSVDVAQLVLRSDFGEGYRYLLAQRMMDSRWEFVGEKREYSETLREAVRHELEEELASVSPAEAMILGIRNLYPSIFAPEYMLHPILEKSLIRWRASLMKRTCLLNTTR
jgi:8-oxo-dGTP pyrophosphatase MutT (NUDIX family)